jgi:hypothetical protein
MTQNASVESYIPSIMKGFPPSKKTPTLYISGHASQVPLSVSSASEPNRLQLDKEGRQKYSPSLESKPYLSRIFIVHDPYPVQPLDLDAEESEDDFIDGAFPDFEPIVPGVRYEYVPKLLPYRVEFAPEPVSPVTGEEEAPFISSHVRSVFEPHHAGPQNYYDTFKTSAVKPYAWKSNAQPYYSIARKRADVCGGNRVGDGGFAGFAGSEFSTNEGQPLAFDFNGGLK